MSLDHTIKILAFLNNKVNEQKHIYCLLHEVYKLALAYIL
jgi:hypothetical protein